MKKIMKLYEQLNNYYGEQYWWPAETFLEMVLGAILVQNTQWRQVEKSIKNLESIMEPETLLNYDIEALRVLIAPSGFSSRKALTIKAFLEWFKTYDYDISILKKLSKYDIRKELLEIIGIGPETADSILLYGLDMPFFIVDTYLKRTFRRAGLPSFTSYEAYQEYIHESIDEYLYLYKQFHALIVAYGKDLNTIFKDLNEKDPIYSLRKEHIQYHETHLNYLGKKDPILKKLITTYGWVHREALPTSYHALIYAITGQLVSAKMAHILYDRFFLKYPTINDCLKASIEDIKSIGLTYKRAEYIYKIVHMIDEGLLNLDDVSKMPIDDAVKVLSDLPGIGVWSAKIILMHGFNKLDVTTYEDLGLRKALFELYDIPQTKKSYDEFMEKFSPYKTVASIYLWEYYHRLDK